MITADSKESLDRELDGQVRRRTIMQQVTETLPSTPPVVTPETVGEWQLLSDEALDELCEGFEVTLDTYQQAIDGEMEDMIKKDRETALWEVEKVGVLTPQQITRTVNSRKSKAKNQMIKITDFESHVRILAAKLATIRPILAGRDAIKLAAEERILKAHAERELPVLEKEIGKMIYHYAALVKFRCGQSKEFVHLPDQVARIGASLGPAHSVIERFSAEINKDRALILSLYDDKGNLKEPKQ